MLRRAIVLLVMVLAVAAAGSAGPLRSDPAAGVAAGGSQVSAARLAHLKSGINLSHWFAQSPNNDYSKAHLDSFTTAQDLALIKSMGFDHVRFTIEPGPLFNSADPSSLQTPYLQYLDAALDMILA